MKKTINVVPLQTVALPTEIEIMCGNIFPAKPKVDPIFSLHEQDDSAGVEDRGARTGHARSGIHIQPHSAYRCFHCSSNEDSGIYLRCLRATLQKMIFFSESIPTSGCSNAAKRGSGSSGYAGN